MAQRVRSSNDVTSHRSRNSDLTERSHLLKKNYMPLHHNETQQTLDLVTSNQVNGTREASFRHSIQTDENFEESNELLYQPQVNYCQTSCRRLPKGKGVILVILIYFLESFAFYGTLSGLQQILLRGQPNSIWIFTFLEGTAGRVVYPVAGVIADTYLGRYQVIHNGLWLLWIGFAILALCQSLVSLYSTSIMIGYILPILSAVVISIGAGSVEVNTISFGVDQLAQGAPSEELSSYFYWYYFNRNTGNLAANIVSLLLFGLPGLSTQNSFLLYSCESLLAVAAITVALMLHYCLQNWYFKDRKRENPLKSIINVIYYSATVKRHPPVFRRAFRHGEGKKSRIELAKIDYDGIFSSEEVENVKTFCRILFLIFTLGGYFATYGAAYSMLGYQINKTTVEALGHENAYFASNFLTLINVMTFIIFLPILNHLLIPFVSGFTMRIRIGCGLVCNILCVVIAAIVQVKAFNLWWLSLPAILVSLGDALTVVTGVEFIYAQSPETMKGLLTGLLYLAYGVFRGVGVVFFHFYSYLDWTRGYAIMYFYVAFTVIATLGFVAYVIVACLYRYRQRPTGDDSESDIIRRGWAQNRFANPNM